MGPSLQEAQLVQALHENCSKQTISASVPLAVRPAMLRVLLVRQGFTVFRTDA